MRKSKHSTGKKQTISQSNNMELEREKFIEEKNEIISLLETLFIKNSVTYSWEQNKRFGSLHYNFLKISSNYKLNDGSIASRKAVLENDLRSKNPQPIYAEHILIAACKNTAMFSLKNNDESERSFKNWRFQILKSDL